VLKKQRRAVGSRSKSSCDPLFGGEDGQNNWLLRSDQAFGMGIGLALSGGGVRAAAFHLGVLRRLAVRVCWRRSATSRLFPAARLDHSRPVRSVRNAVAKFDRNTGRDLPRPALAYTTDLLLTPRSAGQASVKRRAAFFASGTRASAPVGRKMGSIWRPGDLPDHFQRGG